MNLMFLRWREGKLFIQVGIGATKIHNRISQNAIIESLPKLYTSFKHINSTFSKIC